MYLYVPLTPEERAARRAGRLAIREGRERPAYLLERDCRAAWPAHVPTLVYVPWGRP